MKLIIEIIIITLKRKITVLSLLTEKSINKNRKVT